MTMPLEPITSYGRRPHLSSAAINFGVPEAPRGIDYAWSTPLAGREVCGEEDPACARCDPLSMRTPIWLKMHGGSPAGAVTRWTPPHDTPPPRDRPSPAGSPAPSAAAALPSPAASPGVGRGWGSQGPDLDLRLLRHAFIRSKCWSAHLSSLDRSTFELHAFQQLEQPPLTFQRISRPPSARGHLVEMGRMTMAMMRLLNSRIGTSRRLSVRPRGGTVVATAGRSPCPAGTTRDLETKQDCRG